MARALRRVMLGLMALVLLTTALWLALDSQPGRHFLAERIAGFHTESGLSLEIGRIDGDLTGAMVLHQVALRDRRGVFLSAPELRLHWKPFALLHSHLDIRDARVPAMRLSRLPELIETADDGPLLPDIDITLGRLRVDRFVVEPAVGGARQVLALAGKARIADARAQVTLDARALEGGDTVALVLDAVPDANRLAFDLELAAPGDGLVAALAGIDRPLRLTVKGKGDWQDWQGRIAAELEGTQVARLSLSARDGAFRLQGAARPDRLIAGGPSRLMAPALDMDLSARLASRVADLSGGVSGEGLRASVAGKVDLAEGRFDSLRLGIDLLRPERLLDGLQAQAMRADLNLEGAFAAPEIGYRLTARQAAMNGVRLTGLEARGKARVADGRATIPVSARAARLTGLDAVAGGTVNNVRLDGEILAKGSRLLADDLLLRADRIDSKVMLVADLSRGSLAASIDGRIDRYRVESVGLFRVDADMEVDTAPGGYTLSGRINARSTLLTNTALRDFLGGDLVAGANLRYGPDGVVRFDRLSLRAPDLRVDSGQGSYRADGQLALDAQGVSRRYGPLALRVSGTMARLDARVSAPSPGLGLGLAGLEARINGSDDGFRLDARAQSDYGPVSAEVLIAAGTPLTLTVMRGDLGGIGFAGTLRQTPAGPFAGRLDASGRGLEGVVRLDGQGQRQVATASLRARNTTLPGAAGLSIGSAIVDATLVLGDRSDITADVQLARAVWRDLRLSSGRLKLDYRAGAGTARFVADGTSGVPFRLAGSADLQADLWRMAVNGRVAGVEVRTDGPARIRPLAGGYDVLPSRLALGDGRIELAGRIGAVLALKGRLDDLDLALADAVMPGLGIGGTASGTFDVAAPDASAMPRLDARLNVAGLTRTTADMVSQPVDAEITASLGALGGTLRAGLRSRGATVGRVVASVDGLGGGDGSWPSRLAAGRLGGGIRYNGPADVLASFAGLTGQRLAGPIAVGADFTGQPRDPGLTGFVRGDSLTYENLVYGTRLTGMVLAGRFVDDRLEIEQLTARAGDGTVTARGRVSLSAAQGWPMDLSMELENARMARSDSLAARATGSFRLTKQAGEAPLLAGKVRVPEARYTFVRQGAAEVPHLSGVRFKAGASREVAEGREALSRRPGPFDQVRLDIGLAAPERLFVSGMGLESEWRADLRLAGSTAVPRVTGQAVLVRGTLDFAGRSFAITEGRINFTDGTASDPAVTLVASEDIDEVSVVVRVTGRASDPAVAFTSVPSLPQDEVLSRILFGRAIGNLSPVQSLQLAASLNSLRTGGAGLNPLGRLRSATGVDRLSVLAADDANGRGTALALGQYLTKDIYVEFVTDARGFTATQIEVSLNRALSIISQAGGSGASDVQLRYRKNY